MWLFVCIKRRLTGLFTQFKHPNIFFCFQRRLHERSLLRFALSTFVFEHSLWSLGRILCRVRWKLNAACCDEHIRKSGKGAIFHSKKNPKLDQVGVGQGWMQFPHHRDLPKLAWLLHQIFTKVEAESLMKNNHFAAKGEQIYKKDESPYDMNRRFTIVGIYSQSFGKHPTWNQVNLIMLQ